MSFERQFSLGIKYRSRFDPLFTLDEPSRALLENTFERTRDRAMEEPFFGIRQAICEQAIAYAADTSIPSYAYQCLADSHTFLSACLQQKLIDKRYMTLTVGDVSFDGQRLFGVTRESIEDCVCTGISTTDKPRFHVWLTLVDMTVIDLTVVRQLIELQLLPVPTEPVQWLNIWRAERMGRFNYHPMLIDDDFLMRLQRPAH